MYFNAVNKEIDLSATNMQPWKNKIIMFKQVVSALSTLFFIAASILTSSTALAQNNQDNSSVTIIKPDKTVEKVGYAAIDTESFEVGIYAGSLSVEDFGNSAVTGFTLAYHINSRFMAQVGYGKSDVGRAAFEDAVGNSFLSDSDKEFTYTNATAGYRLFHGRSFFGSRNKFDSNLYLIAGLENVEFAGEKELGLILGTSYKIVTTDWLTLNLDLRDHIFDREFLSDRKKTQNIEFTLGFNILF